MKLLLNGYTPAVLLTVTTLQIKTKPLHTQRNYNSKPVSACGRNTTLVRTRCFVWQQISAIGDIERVVASCALGKHRVRTRAAFRAQTEPGFQGLDDLGLKSDQT